MNLPTYLNLDLEAPGLQVQLDGVVADDEGALSLALVHGGVEQLVGEATTMLAGAAAVGVGPDGDVYLVDTPGNRVLRVPACGGDPDEVGCLAQMLSGPRGVLVGPREALYVADAGHGRVLVVDLVTEQLRGVWGVDDLHEPWDLAADSAGRVYVVDHGGARVLRFDLDGVADSAFALGRPLRAPEAIFTIVDGSEELLIVFDRRAGRLRVVAYRLDGTFAAAETRRLHTLLADYALGASTVGDGLLYVAEEETGRILSFDVSGAFVGIARWSGTVAALVLDAQGRLLVAGAGVVRLDAGRPAASGTFAVGPIAAPLAPPDGAEWQLVRARVDPLPDGAHLQLFAWTTDDATATPPDLSMWSPAPLDAAAFRPPAGAAPYLWVGGRLTSSGTAGPVVRGLRVEFDREGWLQHLPAIYARESSDVLEPVLAAFEDALREQEDTIDGLPLLFDPAAAPVSDLDWLAGWLAYDLEEAFDEQTRRAVIAHAFALQGTRGTAEAMRAAIELVVGVQARISEPAAHLRVWQLAGERALGIDTLLAAGEPDGAILGTTAELDRSSLERDEMFGAPLFDATAYRFCVQVYGADLAGDGARALLERVVERERPAETEAHVCVIEPRLRVGHQATVGIDAIAGRGVDPMRLDTEGLLGSGASLADAPSRLTVGDTTRLGRGRAVI